MDEETNIVDEAELEERLGIALDKFLEGILKDDSGGSAPKSNS